jgi:hypothetical protein
MSLVNGLYFLGIHIQKKKTHYINYDYCITSQSINSSLDNYNELCADIALVEYLILVRICVQRVECMRFSPLASSN